MVKSGLQHEAVSSDLPMTKHDHLREFKNRLPTNVRGLKRPFASTTQLQFVKKIRPVELPIAGYFGCPACLDFTAQP